MSLLTTFGGPGCGKTTRLLGYVEKELAAGVPAKQICYTSFTKKAAEEARNRASVQFGMDPKEDLKWFATLHSIAYRSLGLDNASVMKPRHYKEVAKMCGANLTGNTDQVVGMWHGRTRDDEAVFAEQLARARGVSTDELCRKELALDADNVDLWARSLKNWKQQFKRVDFTDMLEMSVDQKVSPQVRVLIVDEAQDLNALQWRMVANMAETADRVYLGGDDDQAIYEWSGADVRRFLQIARRGTVDVLDKSHRLPQKIFDAANRIVNWISERQPKEWSAARPGGTVEACGEFLQSELDFAPSNGTWFLLARNRLHLDVFSDYFMMTGVPFWRDGKSSLDNTDVRATRAYVTVQRGGVVGEDDGGLLLDKLGIKNKPHFAPDVEYDAAGLGLSDMSRPWFDALLMPSRTLQYIRSVMKNGFKLSTPPWVTVSTIHQVKGGEADNVWMGTDMTRRSYEALVQHNPDSEHRVFYVGASRAKKALYVGAQTTDRAYRSFANHGVSL